jgi:hypothetical protein
MTAISLLRISVPESAPQAEDSNSQAGRSKDRRGNTLVDDNIQAVERSRDYSTGSTTDIPTKNSMMNGVDDIVVAVSRSGDAMAD